jgi:hypothetical protein
VTRYVFRLFSDRDRLTGVKDNISSAGKIHFDDANSVSIYEDGGFILDKQKLAYSPHGKPRFQPKLALNG